MSTFKTVDFNIHYVNTLLQNKGKGSLLVIEKFIIELKLRRDSWDKAISAFKENQETLKENKAQAQKPFERLLQEKEIKMVQVAEEYYLKLKPLEENQNKLKKQLLVIRDEEQKKTFESLIKALGEQIQKVNENLKILQDRHKTIIDTLNFKQQEFIQQIKDEVAKLDAEILNIKEIMHKASVSQLKLDNLYRAVAKNPNTLFNDSISHDLILFAHKDIEFKNILNNFLSVVLEQKDYQQAIDKIGKLMDEIFQKSKGITMFELISIYSKLFISINKEGVSVLDKPMVRVFVDPDVEKALRHYRDDLTFPEIIQIAKLSPEIHQKVLSHAICVDFYIQLLRVELKLAKEKNLKFEMPEINWDALIYLTTKWPAFFIKFGQSLNTFSEYEYIKLFQSTILHTSNILKNPISEQIFTKILKLRENSKDTFQKNYKTRDYIRLLYDTVAMASSNEIRSPHYVEVLIICAEINEPYKTNFLKLFNAVEISKVFAQEESIARNEQEDIYLTIDQKFEKKDVLLKVFGVKSYDNLPYPLIRFLQTLRVDVSDHLFQVDNILDKINQFEKNIGLSVISSDKQLPLANAIYHSVVKCAEYISVPKALEALCITKELEKMLGRKINANKELPKI